MRRLARTLSVALLAVLCGCNYTATVRNDTDRSVQLQMIQRVYPNRDWVLETARVEPGQSVRLGPARVTGGKILLEAGERTSTQDPALLKLKSGTTAAVVAYQADGRSLALSRAEKP